ncbi:ComEA family DNA-binding protein [Pedobacter cryotolerans]|uniref:Helix-hairpin-helix domain-containing protein n=1 Tax=Pedobacter cryotolerans TaxID=2571270 RepID=A0A4U1C9D0_9SPHI|nr:helix-hairpin-helix domain-containing protein [Pedobacter cryotolerans]TKC02489.1 helix-hairpin-helix domain-containing protein [Pedobacter cryotolerans]
MRFSILTLLIVWGICAKAQTQEDILIKDLIESIAENLADDFDLSELQDRLTYYRKRPINLNNTNPEELKTLFFLSPIQISNIFTHIKTNGKFIDVLELQSVPEFDIETVNRLLPFVTLNQQDLVDKITLRNIRVLADNDLVLRIGSVLEKPKGFTDLPGSRYLGTQERFLLRYRYDYSNRISASFIAEKDAGETFIKGEKQVLFDYQSFHIGIYNTGKFKKIILGDYSLQFGQGLTLWTGFSFGKAPDVATIAKRDVGLRAYTSANEYSFLRGFATTVQLSKNIEFTPFVSFRNLDGSLSLDENGNEVLENINETGLHRTQTEIKNKNSVGQQVYGGVIQYQKDNLSIGAIGYHSKYSNAFITGDQLYRRNNFVGKSLTNIGLNYNYTYKNIYFFGEAAKSLTSGLAYLNGALISLSSKVSAAVLHRNYQSNYHNFFNQATAEASEAFNEKGLYIGLNINPTKAWNLSFYADYFKFPWLKFRIDAPSDGYEILSQLTYTPTKTFKAFVRYKSELKQQNTDLDVPINFLDNVKRESYRADVSWRLSKTIRFQNRVEVSQFKKGVDNAEFGYMIYQDASYVPSLSKLSGNIRIAYFNTPSFNSRIYAYEDDVLYNFAFAMYNGNGIRTYANLKYKLLKKLDVWARYALFLYKDVETVGSGLDEIAGNKKTDVKLQIRYQF